MSGRRFREAIKKEFALIDWTKSAKSIYNQVRAFNPAPVAFCSFLGEPFKIYQAKVCDLQGKVGEILKADNELIITCGEKSLSLFKVQKAGGKPMLIQDFLRGSKLQVGGIFE